MGEIRSMNIGALGSIYDPDTINDALRAGPKELQDFFGEVFFRNASGAGNERVSGFNGGASGASPAIIVSCSAGIGLSWAASPPAGASKWRWLYSADAMTVTGISSPVTHPRIDTFSLSIAQAADTAVNVGFEGSVPDDVMTQRGCQLTLVRTAGAENASPTAPTAPAGNVKVFEVRFETGGSYAVTETARRLPGPLYQWRTVPWLPGTNKFVAGTVGHLGTDYDITSGAVKIEKLGANGIDTYLLLPLPTDGRALSCTAAQLILNFTEEFDQTLDIKAELVKVTPGGGTEIAGELDVGAIGAVSGLAAFDFYPVGSPSDPLDEFTLGDPEGDDTPVALHIRLRVYLNGGSDGTGELYLYGARLLGKELGGLE